MEGPKHVAAIIDGNRRFARKIKINPLKGHEYGVQRIWDVFDWAEELGIKEFTFYTFSTENFKRDKVEVDYLMKIFYREFD
ncbi:hypothetical protein FJZ53_04065, partial [Candidatus Woesearchaeota archaeon]|nr:hypothetical protein [Candidatus Woesearchaeota archaeon]